VRILNVAAIDQAGVAGSFPLKAAEEVRIDPSVVAALYVEHGEELRRFLHGVLRDGQLANDVLQAAFARLVEVGHGTRQETRKAWLFRVAYHEAMAVRRRDNTGDRVVRRLAWSREATGHAADVPLLRIESVELVRAALAELPPDQQRVVRMRMYEEKTFAVIAAELNIPLGTALGRMRDALAKLRKKLSSHAEVES
jgi:RNA polymerase sigma-70 factor (ECF subfamily)